LREILPSAVESRTLDEHLQKTLAGSKAEENRWYGLNVQLALVVYGCETWVCHVKGVREQGAGRGKMKGRLEGRVR
jgi:hypothetical protein